MQGQAWALPAVQALTQVPTLAQARTLLQVQALTQMRTLLQVQALLSVRTLLQVQALAQVPAVPSEYRRTYRTWHYHVLPYHNLHKS